MSEAIRSDHRFPPSEFIEEEMTERGWSRETLAKESMLGLRVIDEVLSGKHKVNLFVAHGLGLAFGTGREYWVNLQKLYDEESN